MKREPKKDYQVTPIRLPPDVRKKVRLLAAEKDTTMADMAGKLLNLGLAAYYEEGLAGSKPAKKPKEKPAA